MILDDLFEQKPLPAHIKASDLPPAMRKRLTMRDIEHERPRGAYRYRVTPGKPGESPKDFLDLPGAEQYAQATGGRVQPLEEQADPDVQRGIQNLDALERNATNDQPVEIQNETGRAEYQIEKARDKQWVINHAKEWVDAGRTNDLYRYMGTTKGFDFLLVAWQKEDAYRSAQSRREKFEPDADTTPDLYGAQAKGSPRATRYQDESALAQKKNSDLEEAPQGARGRTERMMSQMRARQPQATSDLEALAYELQDAERRDSEEIGKLEREVDNLETDIKSDLQKRIATLTRRRGGIQQAAAADTKIDATLDQLAQVNDQQQRDINTLTRAVASLGQKGTTAPISVAVDAPAPTTPTSPASSSGIEIPPTYRSKPKTAVEPETYPGAVTGLIGQMQRPSTVSPTGQASKQQPTDQPSGEERPRDLTPGTLTKVGGVDPTQWKKVANVKEAEQDLVDRLGGSGFAKSVAGSNVGKKVGSEYGMAKSALGTLGRAIMGRRAPSTFDLSPGLTDKTAPPAANVPAPAVAPIAPAASAIVQPTSYGRPRSPQRQAAMQDLVKQAMALTPAQKAAAMPAGWQDGMPITINKQRIQKNNPLYAQLVAAMGRQPVKEKKKPQPTNPDLWSRAKSAARSKFDVYPSAYANAWAAKWYKSKGGGWRMGKPKKK